MGRSSDRIYTDIAVVGGGIIGSAASYYLTKKGFKVAIIEKGGIASGASGACDGFIFLQSKKDTDVICLTFKSLSIFKGLSEELSYDLEYKNCGGLVIYSGEYGRQDITTIGFEDRFKSFTGEENRDNGSFVEILDGRQIRQLEQHISKDVCSGTYCRYESQVNPLAANIAYSLAAKKNGADIFTGEEVKSFDVKKNGNIKSLATDRGRQFYADEFLLCAGAWSAGLGGLAGIDIPIIPRRGTILVTEIIPQFINHVIIDYDYICCKFDLNRELGFTMEQTASGNLLIGNTREFKGFDSSIDLKKISLLVGRATELFPGLAGVDTIRMFTGFRPYSTDLKPIIGPVPGFSNLWIASGHEGDGIALSPATGMLIGELVEKKQKISGSPGKKQGDEPYLFYGSLYSKIEGFGGIDTRKFSPEKRIKSKS